MARRRVHRHPQSPALMGARADGNEEVPPSAAETTGPSEPVAATDEPPVPADTSSTPSDPVAASAWSGFVDVGFDSVDGSTTPAVDAFVERQLDSKWTVGAYASGAGGDSWTGEVSLGIRRQLNQVIDVWANAGTSLGEDAEPFVRVGADASVNLDAEGKWAATATVDYTQPLGPAELASPSADAGVSLCRQFEVLPIGTSQQVCATVNANLPTSGDDQPSLTGSLRVGINF